MRFAAAQAFRDTRDPELRKVLEGLARQLEPQVEKLWVNGELAEPRKPGDYTNRYPDAWVRTHRLLARFGEDQSLRRLLDAYVLDFNTYPEKNAPLVPMVRAVMSSVGPSLAEAIHAADASPSRLVERLEARSRCHAVDVPVAHCPPRLTGTPLKQICGAAPRQAGTIGHHEAPR